MAGDLCGMGRGARWGNAAVGRAGRTMRAFSSGQREAGEEGARAASEPQEMQLADGAEGAAHWGRGEVERPAGAGGEGGSGRPGGRPSGMRR
jgi:hypothetical protein